MILKVEKIKVKKYCDYRFKDCDNFSTLNVLLLLNGEKVKYKLCQTCYEDVKIMFDRKIREYSGIMINNSKQKCIVNRCKKFAGYSYQEGKYFFYYCEKHYQELGEK